MKKFSTYLMITIAALVVAGFAGSVGMKEYFRDRIGLNTWINDIYCTGKTPDEVVEMLNEQFGDPTIEIIDKEGQSFALPFEFIDYKADFETSLNKYLASSRTKKWYANFRKPAHLVIRPSIEFDEEKLSDTWKSIPFVEEEIGRDRKYSIDSSEDGFVFVDGLTERLDLEKSYCLLKEYIGRADTLLDLAQMGCYGDIEPSSEDLKTAEVWEKVKAFIDTDIVYDMGAEQISLAGKVLSDCVDIRGQLPEVAPDGQVVISEAGVEKFVDELCEAYDTYQKERDFTTALGDVVRVPGVKYGTKLNRDAEVKFLSELLNTVAAGDHSPVKHVPSYEKEANVRGLDDIGGTYIEIDLTNQKMYYFVDRVLTVETNVVTRDMLRKRSTPEGVNYVYNKSRNRTLRGPGYAAFVKYWMAVKDGIGIHDASWRKEFGGEEYLKNGSHGCINTPLEDMIKIYESAELYTPVIMYYRD